MHRCGPQAESGLDAAWGDAFRAEYKQRAAAVTANLTQEPGFTNGNTELLKRILSREIDVTTAAFMCPSSMRPQVFKGMDTEAERLSKVTLRDTGAVSTMYSPATDTSAPMMAATLSK